MCVVVQSSNVSVHKPHVFPRVLKSHKLDNRSNTMARERDRRDRDRPDKDRDRGRDTRSSVNADDVDQLRSQLEEVSGKLERTSQLAVQASRDSGEARSGQQIVLFESGLLRSRLKEVLAVYQSDREAVMNGTKEKGKPLKLLVYDALLGALSEAAARQGTEASTAAEELVALGSTVGISAISNLSRAPEDDRAWVLVTTFQFGATGQKLRSLWLDPRLRPVFAKKGGVWPELGMREGTWRPGRLHQAVCDDLGIPAKGKGKQSTGSGLKRKSETPEASRYKRR